MCCVCMQWIPLGSLVATNNHEEDFLQRNNVIKFQCPIGVVGVHNARAQIGLQITCGSKSGQL